MRKLALAAALAMALSACSDAADDGGGERELLPTPAEPGAATGNAPEVAATGRADALDGERSPAQADGYASAYTALDLAACEVTDSEDREGQWAERTCPGYDGIRLFVDDGDGRFDVDAGRRNQEFETIGAFNNPPETVEWRLKDGEPFAVIYRLSDATEQARGRTVLFVERIGTGSRPGCAVAQVAGDEPNPNRKARELADTLAAGFACDTDEPRIVGNAL